MNVAIKPLEHHEEHQLGFVRRYIFSTDHKVIGKQYMMLSAVMAIIGGFSAYIIRWRWRGRKPRCPDGVRSVPTNTTPSSPCTAP